MENDNIDNVGATQADAPEANVDTRSEDQMLADILRSTGDNPLFQESQSTQHDEIPAPEGTPVDDDRVPQVDDNGMEEPIAQDEPRQDDMSTPSAYELEDLDDFNVMVKINGESTPVNIKELVKGYSTDQSLSQKGRELGDARKQLETDREQKLGEVDNVLGAATQILMKSEKKLSEEYHSVDAEINEAREDGDSHRVSELKDKKEQIQEKYWAAHNERKAMVDTAEGQKKELEDQRWNQQMADFGSKVSTVIPDWSEAVAGDIREFVLSKGIPEEYLPQMADVNVIKFIDDYRRIEQARTVGSKKRQQAPANVTPARQGVPLAQKKQQADDTNKNKVLAGQGSKADNDAFLRNLASRHFD